MFHWPKHVSHSTSPKVDCFCNIFDHDTLKDYNEATDKFIATDAASATDDAEIKEAFYAFLDDEIDDADAARAGAVDVVCRSAQDTIEKE